MLLSKIIKKRKALAPTARRAGWIGCNILIQNDIAIIRTLEYNET